jgi:hypothetical protein
VCAKPEARFAFRVLLYERSSAAIAVPPKPQDITRPNAKTDAAALEISLTSSTHVGLDLRTNLGGIDGRMCVPNRKRVLLFECCTQASGYHTSQRQDGCRGTGDLSHLK